MPFKQSAAKRRAQPARVFRRAILPTRRVWRRSLPSSRHTDRLGRAIGSVLEGGESLALSGALGAGKTALVRGIAAGLGVRSKGVSRTTFVLMHEYGGRLRMA